MMFSMEKNAIVTGSSSGIGKTIAEKLMAEGYNVMMNGIEPNEDFISYCEEKSAEFNVKVKYLQADMSKFNEIEKLYLNAKAHLGSISLLVNNAGIQHVETITSFPDEMWKKIIDINLSSAFKLTKLVLEGFVGNKFGTIINIASAHALVASPYKSAYVAAKHGLLGFTKTTALEFAEQNITANCICPGYVLTPLVEKQIPETAKARNITEDQVIKDVLLKAQPTKKFVDAKEVAEMVVFLASNKARSITGSAIELDGGWTAQ
ncbi:3-hydroxybutyrate dehydrogenase [Vibrio sp. Sgm 5]|uniref:3-hydroxybutyrate dehydrogenase n=1 Tax=Vibrio sp. Sgm 5 TaxID=2994387 RepID=UPI002248A89F|nr:3-hydroxybutyrate dehydrogenase [Vibrio sp. Sgm 5]MCX2789546.1 3-hydroxybutyrate dehydrogenase [Vibrio sp. Sgm 5]